MPSRGKVYALLALILLSALSIRLAPVLLYGMPVSYDSPFHIKAAASITESGGIPEYELSAYQRPNNYPPFYHILLAELSLLSGIGIFTLSKFILPLFASLLCLSIFLFCSRIFGNKKALIASFFAAIMPFLVTNSYDSPENFVLFMLPIILLLLSAKKEYAAAFLYSTAIFWNYFIFLASLPAIILAYRKRTKFLASVFLFSLVFLFFNLYTRGLSFLENKSLEAGMAFVEYNLRNVLPISILAVVTLAIFFSCLYLKKKESRKEEADFFFFFNLAFLFPSPFNSIALPKNYSN